MEHQPLALPSTSVSQNNIGGEILDALPYIDDVDYTEAHRQLALQLIQAECRNFPLTKNYLRHLPEPNYDKFLTPRILEQHANITEKKELEKIDMLRYDVPSPANTTKAGDKRAWQNAINNCKAQMGNQHLRKINLEIIEEFGPEAYLRFNKILQDIAEKDESTVMHLRSQLYEINSRRKRTQLAAGEKLTELGQSWVDLITKNAKLEVEIMNIEKDIRMKAKKLKVDPEIDHKK